jgi:hypothetical protein
MQAIAARPHSCCEGEFITIQNMYVLMQGVS